ncbi:hypothetical protein EVAR_88626_1 [Eumeta japonica]|uniref:Uncharacterized protein n=1 Tax=Eumeta variegata TaxID=151549 RepID=A0A4C1X3Y8_EUMVA|nr:hypothetical protein EVAR_88626_1 [Eumeta japonica]
MLSRYAVYGHMNNSAARCRLGGGGGGLHSVQQPDQASARHALNFALCSPPADTYYPVSLHLNVMQQNTLLRPFTPMVLFMVPLPRIFLFTVYKSHAYFPEG